MGNFPYQFGPASAIERIVYGAERPGYSAKRVSQSQVEEWISFMQAQGIQRIVCLLPDSQLSYYDNLLEVYYGAFGRERVCWAPIEDFTLADADMLLNTILPFLRDADTCTEKTVVHCSGGIGRTGHVLAAWLVSHRGLSNQQAIDAVEQGGRNARESGDPSLDDLLNQCRQRFG